MRFPTFKRVGKSILIFLAIVVCLFIYSLSDHLVNGGLLLHQPVELQECLLISPHLSINELFYKFSTNFIHKNVFFWHLKLTEATYRLIITRREDTSR